MEQPLPRFLASDIVNFLLKGFTFLSNLKQHHAGMTISGRDSIQVLVLI